MRILVTGAAGFIGSHLSEALLAQGHEVVGLDCFTDYYRREIKERNLRALRAHERFRLVEDSLLTVDLPRLLEGVEVVYHQAAQAGVRASWGAEFRQYTEWNILGTQMLLEAARHQATPPRVVVASSSSVYGERETFPSRETDYVQPVSPYGVTKLATEHLAVLYHRNFGLHTASLRYFTVYGPRQRPDMAFHKFLRAIATGQEIPLFGDGRQTRDFTFIADAVEANIAAAERSRPGGVYNVGGGSRVSVLEVLELLREVTGREVRVNSLPRQHGDVGHTGACIERARADLGWAPKVGLREGLAQEWAYIQELLAEGL